MDEVEVMQAIQDMMETDGWQHLEKWLKGRINDHKEQLMHCAYDQVPLHRLTATVYQTVLDMNNYWIEKGKEALEK